MHVPSSSSRRSRMRTKVLLGLHCISRIFFPITLLSVATFPLPLPLSLLSPHCHFLALSLFLECFTPRLSASLESAGRAAPNSRPEFFSFRASCLDTLHYPLNRIGTDSNNPPDDWINKLPAGNIGLYVFGIHRSQNVTIQTNHISSQADREKSTARQWQSWRKVSLSSRKLEATKNFVPKRRRDKFDEENSFGKQNSARGEIEERARSRQRPEPSPRAYRCPT